MSVDRPRSRRGLFVGDHVPAGLAVVYTCSAVHIELDDGGIGGAAT